MRTRYSRIVISAIFTFVCANAHADAWDDRAPAPPPAYNADGTPVVTKSLIPTANGVSTNQAAQGAQGSNGSASDISKAIQAMLQALGSAMMAACQPAQCSCCPAAAALLAMAALAGAQSGANGDSAGQNGYVAGISQAASAYDTSGSLDTVPDFASSLPDGVTYDKKAGVLTLPNGKTFPLSAVSSAGAAAAAGVSGAEYAKIMEMAKNAEKKAVADAKKTDAGGEMFAGGARPQVLPTAAEEALAGGKARDPAADVAGMSKSFNGDMIGVAGDSIFLMMARRYKQKSNEQAFLQPESQPEMN